MQGETVLITGGAKRLGRAAALNLAENGYHVVIHYNTSSQEAAALIDLLSAFAISACSVQGSLSTSDSCTVFLENCRNTAGPVHHLVNNAAVFPEDTLEEITIQSLESNFTVNTVAPLMISKKLREAGTLNSVTNLLDTRIVDYDKKHVSYHLSKRALMSLTSMMALEWAPEVRVNAVAPGLILQPEGEDTDYLQKLAHTNPLNTIGNENDISEAILYLIKSSFVTGQIIYVDGGRHLKGRVYE